jgi:hypothetical protein
MLALNETLEPALRDQISERADHVSLNPLENDIDAEARLAEQQFDSLEKYAKDPGGLAAQVERDRRAELVPLEHSRTERIFLKLANVLTFGKYVHREAATDDMQQRLSTARSLAYHVKFLREAARSTPQIEVKWSLEEVRESLQFVAEHGTEADSRAVAATAKIFARTTDEQTRRACIESLSKMANPKARLQLIKISEMKDLDPSLRELISLRLNNPDLRLEPISTARKADVARSGQQE